MHQIILNINEEIVQKIKSIEKNFPQDYSKATEKCIVYVSKKLEEATIQFESNETLSPHNEIEYFKNIKCPMLALIQYYKLIQKVEMNKPALNKKKVKQYYLKKLYKIKKKLSKQKCFYQYFKSGANYMDHQFFRRIDKDLFISDGKYILSIDKRNNTPVIHQFAQVESYEMFRNYLKRKIKGFDNTPANLLPIPKQPLRWTTSKTDLIELIYAFHASGTFNNGKADIKEIAEYLQQVFNVELGQYNRVFYDIRARKINKTKLLDTLKDNLLRRIKETDNELFM